MEVQVGLFTAALGVEKPMYIGGVRFDKDAGELHIEIDFERGASFKCPKCGKEGCNVKDTEDKTWRHLNFFQYKSYIHFRTPYVSCRECGSHIYVPFWGRARSGFTLLFEAFVLAMAKEMPISDIAQLVGENDTRIWRIIKQHTEKAYRNKDLSGVTRIGIDETSAKKGHNYVSVAMDMDKGEVIFATAGKSGAVLKELTEELPKHNGNAANISAVSMDMSSAFISGAQTYLPGATVTFDKFHVIKHINEAVDAVRRSEVKTNLLLKSTRYIWLKNPDNLTEEQKNSLKTLSKENLKTAKAYQLRLSFQDIYNKINDIKSAEEAIKKWISWAIRSRLKPIIHVAGTIIKHIDGIVRYFETRLTAGKSEGMNMRIQLIKRRARGFRNIRNFINLIYLEGGNLLLPAWG